MKLRDQLRTHRETFYNWPPIWANTRQDPTDKPQGEIGNLQQVFMNDDGDILFIAIDYQGRRYMGAIGFDSPALCWQIYILLQSHIGLSIKEIGDIDLP
jgi:hypothetical protein